MRSGLMLLSFAGLVLTIVPSFLVFTQMMSREMFAALMTVGTVLWFATAPFWMRKDER